jgi:tight adherence protein B
MIPALFLFLLALSFGIVSLMTRPAKQSKSMQLRLVTIQHPVRARAEESKAAELEKIEQRNYADRLGQLIKSYKFSKTLEILLVHADSTMSVGAVVIATLSAAAVGLLLTLLFAPVPAVVGVATLAGASAPYVLLRFKRSRRLKAFNNALPDAIELMARALRAGHSISSAIELIAEQCPEPLAGEFAQVYQQQKFGLRFRDALLQMGDRIPSRDLHFLITAILVQRETGGDLTEILDRTSHVIRERVRIEGEVRTHTAQGRLTGWILSLLPVIMLALINLVSPGYSSLLFHDPVGQKLLYAGGTMIVIGALIIRKVVDVTV